MNYPTTPLQTAGNCVAYSYSFAIEQALAMLPPEYHRRVNRVEIEKIVGAPADVREAAKRLAAHYPWLLIDAHSTVPVFNRAPFVVAVWRNRIAHAVCFVDYLNEYDPAFGKIVPTWNTDEMNSWHTVMAVQERTPVANRWRKYGWYRTLCKLVNYDSIP
jgi:hypothetical protein